MFTKVKNVLRTKKQYKKILVLPDIHCPWWNEKAVKKAHEWYKKHKPDLVIQLGDLIDGKAWSRWQGDVDDPSPCEEFVQAEKQLKKLHKLFPEMVILRGNHDNRILQRAVEAGLPSAMFNDVDEVFNYPGWTWIPFGHRLYVETARGPICFMHGDEMGGTPIAKATKLGCSVIQGHTHKASCTHVSTDDRTVFGAEAGVLMDPLSKAAHYAVRNPVGNTVGFGVVKYGVFYFVSLNDQCWKV